MRHVVLYCINRAQLHVMRCLTYVPSDCDVSMDATVRPHGNPVATTSTGSPATRISKSTCGLLIYFGSLWKQYLSDIAPCIY
jgi:hypothetical protein